MFSALVILTTSSYSSSCWCFYLKKQKTKGEKKEKCTKSLPFEGRTCARLKLSFNFMTTAPPLLSHRIRMNHPLSANEVMSRVFASSSSAELRPGPASYLLTASLIRFWLGAGRPPPLRTWQTHRRGRRIHLMVPCKFPDVELDNDPLFNLPRHLPKGEIWSWKVVHKLIFLSFLDFNYFAFI